jgi:hypothetical protein
MGRFIYLRMKHPAYRVPDILLMDKEWRDKLFDFARGALQFIPNEVYFYNRDGELKVIERKEGELKVELVGSLASGRSSVWSDIDFNFAFRERDGLTDWNHQIPFKRWFHTGDNRKAIEHYSKTFQDEYGVKIDFGFTDPESWGYNTYVDLEEMKLYHRGDLLDNFVPLTGAPIIRQLDKNPIDLNTFNSTTLPPVSDRKRRFDGMRYVWVKEPYSKRVGEATKDEWEDILPEWVTKYGDKLCTYEKVLNSVGMVVLK